MQRHLGHRSPIPAELQDSLAFGCQDGKIARFENGRRDQRLDGELVPGLCPPTGNCIRPDELGPTVFLSRKAETGPSRSRPLIP